MFGPVGHCYSQHTSINPIFIFFNSIFTYCSPLSKANVKNLKHLSHQCLLLLLHNTIFTGSEEDFTEGLSHLESLAKWLANDATITENDSRWSKLLTTSVATWIWGLSDCWDDPCWSLFTMATCWVYWDINEVSQPFPHPSSLAAGAPSDPRDPPAVHGTAWPCAMRTAHLTSMN